MLTISQLASYAGVTVRAIRHYHAKGLLAEPDRDHSGYRRYDAAAVVELVRIRTLADAGVPLSRVRELLRADADQFAAAIADIDHRLRVEIRERQKHRDRIARLAAGDSLALPAEAVAYLDRLRALELPARVIDAERDAWILVAAQLPQHMPVYMEAKQRQLDDPAVFEFYVDIAEAIEWRPDDPRVEAIADRLAELLDAAESEPVNDVHEEFSDELAELLDTVFLESVPIGRRLIALLEQRGWTGWTKNKRIAAPAQSS